MRLAVLIVWGAFGFGVGGGPAGLVLSFVCLIIGLLLVVASTARGIGQTEMAHAAPQETRMLVLLKDIHARPQRGGKFQGISDPNQT